MREYNPVYYGDIEIEWARLDKLPEDDVPVEISETAWQDSSEDVAAKESETYVPNEDSGVGEGVGEWNEFV